MTPYILLSIRSIRAGEHFSSIKGAGRETGWFVGSVFRNISYLHMVMSEIYVGR